jgi:hypothetical protein
MGRSDPAFASSESRRRFGPVAIGAGTAQIGEQQLTSITRSRRLSTCRGGGARSLRVDQILCLRKERAEEASLLARRRRGERRGRNKSAWSLLSSASSSSLMCAACPRRCAGMIESAPPRLASKGEGAGVETRILEHGTRASGVPRPFRRGPACGTRTSWSPFPHATGRSWASRLS